MVSGASVSMPPVPAPELDAPPVVPEDESGGMVDVLPGVSEGEVVEVPELYPELLSVLPPVVPAHALSSIAHAMGNIHFIIKITPAWIKRKYAHGAHSRSIANAGSRRGSLVKSSPRDGSGCDHASRK